VAHCNWLLLDLLLNRSLRTLNAKIMSLQKQRKLATPSRFPRPASLVEYRVAGQGRRDAVLMRNGCIKIGHGFVLLLYGSREAIQTAKPLRLFRMPKPRSIQRAAKHCKRLIVCLQWHGERMAVLSRHVRMKIALGP
jgi:hypothetical protein